MATELQHQPLYRHFMEAPFPVAIFKGPEHRIELANRPTLQAWGKGDEVIGLPLADALPELREQPFLAWLDEVYATGRPFERRAQEAELPAGPGGALERVYFDFVYSPLRDADGRVEGVLLSASVVTGHVLARREAERALARAEASEAQLRELVENMPELAWHARPDGFIEFYNRRWYEYTGTTPEQMEGWGWQRVHDPAVLPAVLTRWQHSIATGEPFEMEFPLRGADGVFRAFLTRVRPLRSASGELLRWIGTNTNVDAHRKLSARNEQLLEELARALDAERAARKDADEQRAVLDLVIEQSGEGIIMADEAGVIRIFNPAAAAQHGIRATAVAAPGWTSTFGLLRIDGQPLPLEETPLFKAVNGVASKDAEWKVRQPSGEVRTLVGTASPLLRPDGSRAGGVLITRDETERRRRDDEREKLLRALARSNADLDQFAYVASHDLRAPLRGIANLAAWIEEDGGDTLSADVLEHLRMLRGRVARLDALVDGILHYARAGSRREAPEVLDTGVVFRDIIDLLSPAPPATVRVAGEMPTLLAPRAPFQQVFLNLLSNALKHAQRKDVEVVVEAQPDGDAFVFSVRDNGAGIAPAYHERIWQLFQTLRPRDEVEGTGIGLSVVQRLVEAHGGSVGLTSAEGEGATFRVRWPRAPS